MPRLLIVDDLGDICEVIGSYLREEGHIVTATSDGAAALRALISEPFDGVIVDVVLPGVSVWKWRKPPRRVISPSS